MLARTAQAPVSPPVRSMPCGVVDERGAMVGDVHLGRHDLDHRLELAYKMIAVQVSPSNGPGEWQESDREHSRTSRHVKAAPSE